MPSEAELMKWLVAINRTRVWVGKQENQFFGKTKLILILAQIQTIYSTNHYPPITIQNAFATYAI